MSKPRVYVDACCLIDLAKHRIGEPLAGGREREIDFIKMTLEAHRAGELEAYTSILTIAECLHVNGKIPDEVKSLFKSVLTSGQYLRLISPTPLIAEAARDLRWVEGIEIKGRGADYIHLASAMEVRCAEMLTLDGSGKRHGIIDEAGKILIKTGISVRVPSKTQSLTDERRQASFRFAPTDIEKARSRKRSQGRP